MDRPTSSRPALLLALAATMTLGLLACGGEEPPPAPDASSQRTLAQGQLVGYAHPDRDAHVWKGIPFAKPPVGERRWRAPELPDAWDGLREATTSGEKCVQLDMMDPTEVVGDEDCLFLDVYAPKFAADAVPEGDARKPVMVWIHGGGNSIGDATVYDGSRIAVDGDVIVVAIQYRLGVLGWFTHPALRATATGREDASGNYGTLDTIRSLEWVRDNIAHFGGDPGNVTVFGESAGGLNVFALLMSPRASGLFHRAISQSGIAVSVPMAQAETFADNDPRQTVGSNEVLLRHLLTDGRASDRASAKQVIAGMTEAEIEKYLRGKSAEDLLSVFDVALGGGMYFVPQLLRDGYVISSLEPHVAFSTKGEHNAVPTIAGVNREETKLFSLMMSPNISRFMGIITGVEDQRAHDLDGEYGGMLWRADGMDGPLEAMAKTGRPDVWGYRFDWDELGQILWLDLASLLGASHAIEILFVFGFTDMGHFTDNVYANPTTAALLSEQMRSYWTHFAHTGRPARGAKGELDLPQWQPWGAGTDDPKFLVIDSAAGGGFRMEGGTVEAPDVVSRLANDERVQGDEERCGIARNLMTFSEAMGPSDYEAFAGGICEPWPFELPPLPGGA